VAGLSKRPVRLYRTQAQSIGFGDEATRSSRNNEQVATQEGIAPQSAGEEPQFTIELDDPDPDILGGHQIS
jgi:hypothetical protein